MKELQMIMEPSASPGSTGPGGVTENRLSREIHLERGCAPQ